MGLVRDECLVPTYDAPELGYAKESTNQQYVPDVFYKVNASLLLEYEVQRLTCGTDMNSDTQICHMFVYQRSYACFYATPQMPVSASLVYSSRPKSTVFLW